MKHKNYGAILIIVISSTFLLYAFSTGINGVTRKPGSTPGCTCHNSLPTSGVSVAITGPEQLSPSETATYTVTISGGPLSRAGTNISATGGTLTPIDGQGLQKMGEELTHQLPKEPSGGTVSFQFSFKAPDTEGSITMYANGNSVNFNGQNTGDQWNFAPNKTITISPASDVNDEEVLSTYSLNQNYPNPFNPSTNIIFTMAEAGNVKLDVYNLAGELVSTLVNGYRNSGEHTISFNATGLSSGVYFYKLTSGSFTETKKMILTR